MSDSELTPMAAPMPRACVLMLAMDREAVWLAFGPIWKISFWPTSKVSFVGATVLSGLAASAASVTLAPESSPVRAKALPVPVTLTVEPVESM